MGKKSCLLIILVFVCGCASARHAVPLNLLGRAQVPGFQDVRAFSGIPSDAFKKDFIELLEQEQKKGLFSFFDKDPGITYSMLAISGGAANGAYGAGLLKGWSEHGSRPVFKIVTGISTGAIIAPFAFLGSRYDSLLERFYTKYSTRDVMLKKFFFQSLLGNSLASTRPLKSLIEEYFDGELLKEIAAEHEKGRRLYVGTTNLDAQRLVIWDMGKIASIGGPGAVKLFRRIILASASVPIAFPPVYMDVEVDNEMYDEMHVDGGVVKQVFFLYDVMQGFDRAIKEKGIDISRIKYRIYVIRNGFVDPVYKEIPDRIMAISARSIDTVLNVQSVGDLYQLYSFTEMSKGDFNLASIPQTYTPHSRELFDPVEMARLFDLGYKEALESYPWKKAPPGAAAYK